MIFATTVACFPMGLNVGGGALDPFGVKNSEPKGSYELWKVMEIDSVIFQELESPGKEVFKMAT